MSADTLERLREILAEQLAVPPEAIQTDTDLVADLGVAGDDGHDLLAVLDEAFDIRWDDLFAAVHFGQEGFWPPLPWHLPDSGLLYRSQPLLVSDLVHAIELGRWQGTALVPCSGIKRLWLYFLSYQPIVLVAAVGWLIWFAYFE